MLKIQSFDPILYAFGSMSMIAQQQKDECQRGCDKSTNLTPPPLGKLELKRKPSAATPGQAELPASDPLASQAPQAWMQGRGSGPEAKTN